MKLDKEQLVDLLRIYPTVEIIAEGSGIGEGTVRDSITRFGLELPTDEHKFPPQHKGSSWDREREGWK